MCYRKQLLLISLVYPVFLMRSQAMVEQLWSICSKRESVNTTLQSSRVISPTQCISECMRNLECKSGHICQEVDSTKTCSLSSDWPLGFCDDLTASENCTSFKLLNPCQNEGTLNPDGQSCSCVNHWYDTFCQRYRYDCTELEGSPAWTIIKPKGSSQSFLLRCSPHNTVVALVQSKLQQGQLNKTFEEYKFLFGTSLGGAWSGLEVMHALTQQGEYRLEVNLNYMTGRIAVYDDFKVNGEDSGYSFSYATFRSDLSNFGDGFATNAMTGTGNLAGQPFSTYDKDPYGCAALYGAGWWYDANCGPVLLWDPATNRGRWPSSASSLNNVPAMFFRLQLLRFY